MIQLFKEVLSPKKADKAEAEKLTAGETKEVQTESSGSETKKGKHGDPGVCCGGCS